MLTKILRKLFVAPAPPKESAKDTPFWKGVRAFPSRDNPYAAGTQEHEEWQEGWKYGNWAAEIW